MAHANRHDRDRTGVILNAEFPHLYAPYLKTYGDRAADMAKLGS